MTDDVTALLNSLDDKPTDDVPLDGWNRYLLPHPITGKLQAWSRVSTIAKSVSDQWALGQWSCRHTALGLSKKPKLLDEIQGLHPEKDKNRIQSIVDEAMEVANAHYRAQEGTDFHTDAQFWEESGQPSLGEDDSLELHLYQKLLEQEEITVLSEYIERVIVIPDLGVAGTLDKFLYKEEWELPRIGDLKTGKTSNLKYLFNETSIQEALYSRGTYMWTGKNNGYMEMPEIDQQFGVIIHVPIGEKRASLWNIDIDEGWAAVDLCFKVREWRKQGFNLASLMRTVRV